MPGTWNRIAGDGVPYVVAFAAVPGGGRVIVGLHRQRSDAAITGGGIWLTVGEHPDEPTRLHPTRLPRVRVDLGRFINFGEMRRTHLAAAAIGIPVCRFVAGDGIVAARLGGDEMVDELVGGRRLTIEMRRADGRKARVVIPLDTPELFAALLGPKTGPIAANDSAPAPAGMEA